MLGIKGKIEKSFCSSCKGSDWFMCSDAGYNRPRAEKKDTEFEMSFENASKQRKTAFLYGLGDKQEKCFEKQGRSGFWRVAGACVAGLAAWCAWQALWSPPKPAMVVLSARPWGASPFASGAPSESPLKPVSKMGWSVGVKNQNLDEEASAMDCSSSWEILFNNASGELDRFAALGAHESGVAEESAARRSGDALVSAAAYLMTCSKPTPEVVRRALMVESLAQKVWAAVLSNEPSTAAGPDLRAFVSKHPPMLKNAIFQMMNLRGGDYKNQWYGAMGLSQEDVLREFSKNDESALDEGQ